MANHFWMCSESLCKGHKLGHSSIVLRPFHILPKRACISLKNDFTSHKRGKRVHHFPLHFLATNNFSCLVLNETMKHTKHRASLSKDSHTSYTIHWNMQRTNIICLPVPSLSWSYQHGMLNIIKPMDIPTKYQ